MTSKVYPKWKEARLQSTNNAALDGTGATGLFVALIDTGTYTYSDAHEFYSDLSGIVGTPQELTTKTFASGVLDAADSTFPAVTGASCEALAIYVKNAGANTTWRLFAYIDSGVTGLPVTPNGTDIIATWHASGIVAL